jgi:hypothetical protein
MYAHFGYTLLWSVQSLPLLSLTPLPPTPSFSTAFNTHPCILYLHILWYAILLISIILFSFPCFPEFHRVVTLFLIIFWNHVDLMFTNSLK